MFYFLRWIVLIKFFIFKYIFGYYQILYYYRYLDRFSTNNLFSCTAKQIYVISSNYYFSNSFPILLIKKDTTYFIWFIFIIRGLLTILTILLYFWINKETFLFVFSKLICNKNIVKSNEKKKQGQNKLELGHRFCCIYNYFFFLPLNVFLLKLKSIMLQSVKNLFPTTTRRNINIFRAIGCDFP